MNSKRLSNIELLRIFSMLMIISYHICCHCVAFQLTDDASIAYWGNAWFNHPGFYPNLLLLSLLTPLGKIGNVIFITITGYFMVSKGTNISIFKIGKKILSQVLFATVFLTAISLIVYRLFRDYWFFSLISISSFNDEWWFIGYYFGIILFASLWFNRFLASLDKTRYQTLLIVLFCITQFGWITRMMESLGTGISIAFTGILLYALGGYFRRYSPLSHIRIPTLLLTILICFFFIFVSDYNNTASRVEEFHFYKSESVFKQRITGYSDNSFICIVLGILIFEVFSRIRIAENRSINFLGSSTLMVYFLHDNPFFRSIAKSQDWITLLYQSPFRFTIKIILWTLVTFTICALCFVLYLAVCRIVRHFWLKSAPYNPIESKNT